MKILIQNYTSPLTTEPMYLDACFNKTSSMQSRLWSNEVSTFDIMDMYKPDYVLCHYKFMSNDLIKYLSNNDKHKLLLNITGCDESTLNTIESILKSNKVTCELFINSFPDEIPTARSISIKTVNLLPGVDLFLTENDNFTFNLDAGIISTSKKELVEKEASKYRTYHKIKFVGAIENDDFDISGSVPNLVNLYGKYDNFVIADDAHFTFSQLFFDSAFRAKRVILKPPSEQQELVEKILASLFHYQDNKDIDIAKATKAQIKSKHTCFNRASRLARLLKNETASSELLKMSEAL